MNARNAWLVVMLACAAAVPPVLAHGMRLQLCGDGKTVSGVVTFSSGEPAASEWVEMFDLSVPTATPQAMASAADGSFRFPGVAGRHYRIVVTGQEDHAVESRIVLEVNSRGRPVSSGSTHGE